MRRHRPEVVVTLGFDLTWPFGPIPGLNMADHRNVGIAVLDACRDAGNRWIFPELLEEGHEAWSGVRLVAVAASSRASHGVDVTDSLDRGIASLEAHAAYLRGLGDDAPRPADFLRAQAEQLAPRFDGRLVTAFELIAIEARQRTGRSSSRAMRLGPGRRHRPRGTGRSVVLELLGEVVLDAHGLDEVQLRLEPVGVVLLVLEAVLEELAGPASSFSSARTMARL